MAEPKQIQTLFHHLIDNAIKFHAEKLSERRVSITAKDQNDAWLFEIKDNGIGIAKEYYDEVFRLFRRLEPDKYPGIGAGLTMARKIVTRHGGEITISCGIGNGTSVLFTIAKSL